ncbi:MAG: hypothetical protein PHE89_05835 [Alphaproteobacteria bacterium]|nr:hypothetical protein [Alphaproteobacteria bacterium]
MSNKKHSQIWEENSVDKHDFLNNKELSRAIINLLKHNHPNKTAECVAANLNFKIKRVQNWIYIDTGLTAFDLLMLMQKYDCIKKMIVNSLN